MEKVLWRDLQHANNYWYYFLFLCEWNLHSVRWGDLKSVEGILRGGGVCFVIELHECYVVPTRDQSHFFESREPNKKIGLIFWLLSSRNVHSHNWIGKQWTYWLNNIWSITSVVSSGRFVRNRIWLGGCSPMGGPIIGFITRKSTELVWEMIIKSWDIFQFPFPQLYFNLLGGCIGIPYPIIGFIAGAAAAGCCAFCNIILV